MSGIHRRLPSVEVGKFPAWNPVDPGQESCPIPIPAGWYGSDCIMNDDMELLRQYADNRDEAAFEELVKRHLSVVYGAALRHLHGDVHLAADAAQSVFTDLARKAPQVAEKLQNGATLVGWLYTGAHFAATRLRRADLRRSARELPTGTMIETVGSNQPDPAWETIRPLLDEAMRELPEKDRSAILLRYFSGRDLRSIGGTLGLSDDAARKRIERGLDRLRTWLAKRGITTTGAALAAALSAHASPRIEPEFAKRIATTAQGAVQVAPDLENLPPHPPRFSNARIGMVGAAIVGLLAYLGIQHWRHDSTPAPSAVAETAEINGGSPAPAITAEAGDEAPASRVSTIAPVIRIPKSLLARASLNALTMANGRTREFLLADPFVKALKMTASEVIELESSINWALHRYRTEAGQRLEPVSTNAVASRHPAERLEVLEQARFHLKPFPEQITEILTELEASVLRILGPQRAELFQKGSPGLDSELPGWAAHLHPRSRPPTSQTYTYRLVVSEFGAYVDLQRSDANGFAGYDHAAELDRYAPSTFQPTLARWRQWLAENQAKFPPPPPGPSGEEVERIRPIAMRPRSLEPDPSGNAVPAWNDESPDVELPQSAVELLGIPGLNPDETVTEDATLICDLTPQESALVQRLYADLKSQFLELERRHFRAVPGGLGTYLVDAFPTEAAALERAWRDGLRNLVGARRVELLDRLIRTRMDFPQAMQRGLDVSSLHDAEADWLQGGKHAIEIGLTQDGSLEYRIDSPANQRGQFGPLRPDGSNVPIRWRHLITSELLAKR